MSTARIIRPRWQRRVLSVVRVTKRWGFWARLLPLAALYGLTVYALVNVPTLASPQGLPRTQALYYAFRFFV